ncbi:MAG: hypothetical protein QNJ54_29810 [Prochloraceae cyanobacterium]|nr:hypothetical protein [Prochloraceae cyanobacterium]
MVTIIFVHGTGGRKKDYAITFQQIETILDKRKPEVKLVPCLWGEAHGTKLNARGASIPDYELTKGESKLSNQEDAQVLLWKELYRDSFYEIRLLGLRELQEQYIPMGISPSQELNSRIEQLISCSELKTQLERFEIAKVFEQACQIVTGSESKLFERLLETASRPLEQEYAAIARAIIAETRILCKELGIYPPLLVDSKLRDEAVDCIYSQLTQDIQSRGLIGDWLKGQFAGLATVWGTNRIKRERGALSDAAYPFAGDILLYQAKGNKICDYIQRQIELVDSPVVLLAHSLGGIACVDLLVRKNLPRVELVITVGSQAPFLYEIDALQSLSYGRPLPEHFPKWLNIYDLRDFLSYVGDREGIFKGRMKDVKVDNKQPFPEAHSAYWSNPDVWNEILNALP